MNRVPVWLLPAVLVLVDLVVWPGIPLLRGEPVSPAAAAATACVGVVAAVALRWRRSHPTTAAVAVVVVLGAGTWGLPENAHLVMSFAGLIALYSVAVHRGRRPTLMLAAASLIWQAVVWGLTEGVGGDFAGGMAVAVVVYLAVVAAGRGRARWHADRAAAAARLAEAEARRARAAETERHRLARELHDVTAHHLTSIVVTASAAQRLAGKRPELAAEAVAFAERTGRETLGALRRLVAILQDPSAGSAAPGLADLVDGFRDLGGTVTLDAPAGDLPPAVAEAVCGIAREALTNTLRYAAGAPVHVAVVRAAGVVELTVTDEGDGGAGVVGTLGSGRGVSGMRERAAALGGTLTAGPREVGGWQVRAVLPDTPGPGTPGPGTPGTGTPGTGTPGTGTPGGLDPARRPRPAPAAPPDPRPEPDPTRSTAADLADTPAPRAEPDPSGWAAVDVADTPGKPMPEHRSRRASGTPGKRRPVRQPRPVGDGRPDAPGRTGAAWRPGSATTLDGLLVALALAGPAGTFAELLADPGLPAAGQVALVVLGAAGHAVPLMWRRSHPWTVLAVVAATVWVWPALIAAGLLPTGVAWLVLAGFGADLMAVYAVARYGRRPHLDWLAVPAVIAAFAGATGAATALQPMPDAEPVPLVVALLVSTMLTGIALLVPVPAGWVLGYLVRTRRERLRQREDHAVAASIFWAHNTAWAERARVAAGLRAAVLRHTEAMVAAAGAADLDGVLDAARAALEAMRGLLSGLHDDGRAGARDPQPTLASIGALADRWRSGGRDLDVEVLAAGPGLPADVDVSAYRVVELLLAADTGRAVLRVDAGGDPVRISIAPAPADPDGEIGAGLRARAVAVGGEVAMTPGGLEIRLPARLGPVDVGEVASSPSG